MSHETHLCQKVIEGRGEGPRRRGQGIWTAGRIQGESDWWRSHLEIQETQVEGIGIGRERSLLTAGRYIPDNNKCTSFASLPSF